MDSSKVMLGIPDGQTEHLSVQKAARCNTVN